MTSILLRRSVHFRRVGDSFIFLDVERDAYFSLDREKSERLDALIAGEEGDGAEADGRINAGDRVSCEKRPGDGRAEILQSGCDATIGAARPGGELGELTGALAAAGLIARTPEEGKRLRAVSIASPNDELFPGGLAEPARAGAGRLFAGLVACASASAMLASRSFAANAARVGRRRSLRAGACDIAGARLLVAEFAGARTLFPREKSCLFESLSLIEFLAGARLYPRWTFGVRSDPFAAHCWVEADGVVLNDGLETTRAFAPIFSA